MVARRPRGTSLPPPLLLAAAVGLGLVPIRHAGASPGLPECTFEACPRCLSSGALGAANLSIALDDGTVWATPLRIGRAPSLWDSQSLHATVIGILASEALGVAIAYVPTEDEAQSWLAVNNCIGWSDYACDQLDVAGEAAMPRKLFKDPLSDVMFVPQLPGAATAPDKLQGTQLDYDQRQGFTIGPSGYTVVDGIYQFGGGASGLLDARWMPLLEAEEARRYLATPQQLLRDGVAPSTPNASSAGCASALAYVQAEMDRLASQGWSCADGWWLCPACAAFGDLWPSRCAAMITDEWGDAQPQLYKSLAAQKVPLARVIVGYDNWYRILSQQMYNVTFNWWTLDASLSLHHAQRVSFPWEFELRPDVLVKAAWMPALQASATLRYLLETAFLRTPEMEDMLAALADAYAVGLRPGPGTFQKVACDWVRKSEGVWGQWLPSARNCVAGQVFDNSSQQCAPCPRGSYAKPRSAACHKCPPGSFADGSGLSACTGCDAGRFSASEGSSSAEACARCPPGAFSEAAGSTSCRVCNATLTTPFLGATGSTDCTCRVGTYLRRWPGGGPGGADEWCSPCTLGLLCAGGEAPPTQAAGFAAGLLDPTTQGPTTVVECDGQGPCPGGTPLGSCPAHREGAACDLCEVGYTPASAGCAPCSAGSSSVPLILFLLGATLCLVLLVVYAMRKPGPSSSSILTLTLTASIMVNVLQTLSSIGKLARDWPEPMASLYSMLRIFTFDLRILHPTCVLHTNRPEQTYLGSLLIHPIYALVLAVVTRYLRFSGRKVPGEEAVNVQGIVVLSLYIALSVVALLPWQCRGNPDGTSSVATQRSVLCWASPAHAAMVAFSLVALLVYIGGGLAIVTWATWRYPAMVSGSRGVTFIRRFQFLFARFQPQRYWFGLVFVLRSLAVAALPVLLVNQPGFALTLLVLVLTVACALQCRLWPWRIAAANRLDAATAVLALLILNGGAFLMESDANNMKRFLQFFFSAVLCALGLAGLVTVVSALTGALWPSKRFGIFLCHHKQAAAVLARWCKLVIGEHTSERVFLDSDELDRLDRVFSVVAHDTKHLVVLLTHETLQRIWCAGEIASAVLHSVGVVPVTCNDFAWPTEEFVESLGDLWTDAQKGEVSSMGVRIEDIQAGYRAISREPAVALNRSLPQLKQERAIAQVISRCDRVRGVRMQAKSGPCSTQSLTLGLADAQVLIAGNLMDAESACICAVLQRLLMAAMQQPVRVLYGDEEIGEETRVFVATLTRGVLQHAGFAASAVQAHRWRNVMVVPVIADQYFQFPGPLFWEDLERGHGGPDMSSTCLTGVSVSDIVGVYRWLFNVLGMRFSAHGSLRIQQGEIEELVVRINSSEPIASMGMHRTVSSIGRQFHSLFVRPTFSFDRGRGGDGDRDDDEGEQDNLDELAPPGARCFVDPHNQRFQCYQEAPKVPEELGPCKLGVVNEGGGLFNI